HDTEVPMPRADLIHIFYNVIKNSIENLLDNNIRSPRISVIKSPHSDKINISIHDNGTGLSKEDFNEMTAQTNIPRLLARRGMGLRLTRRLIERSGGTMAIKETDNGSNLNIELRAVI
ncbi:MAG: ATP-binding protein, partial [Bacteriovoracaceae bacterium]|nr:ATP-binding protein [Bacteriovoracaceae bacterium]